MLPNVGITNIRKEDYQTMLKISADTDNMHETWDEWKKAKEELKRKLKKEGFAVVDVLVLPQDLILYCRENGLRINGKARSQYVQYKVSTMSF